MNDTPSNQTRTWNGFGVLVAVLCLAGSCRAGDNLWGHKWRQAVTPRFDLTQIHQQNVHGGTSMSSRSGRYAGSYALETQIDLETILGVRATGLCILVEGGWPSAGGIDSAAVGSYFGVNAGAIDGQWGDLSELWLEQTFADGCLLARVGKLDLTGTFQCRGCDNSFDGSLYANDETSQFLNGALVNNPTIPFPDLTLGLAFFASPRQAWHLGWALAVREDEEVSWGSTDSGVFAVFEAGFQPEQKWLDRAATAQYRAGLWCATDGRGANGQDEQRGAYLSVSQPILPVNGWSDEDGGLSVFARAGWADGPGAHLAGFWSVGLQYQGPWSASDAVGLGMARGHFSRSPDSNAPLGRETVWELYYNTPISAAAAFGPNVQYVSDPGGRSEGNDALVLGLRLAVVLE